MLIYILCYDLEDDTLRNRAARLLLSSGQRVQESVYELWFRTPAQFEALLAKLRKLLPKGANVRWYRLTVAGMADSGSLDPKPPSPPPVAVIW